jgi:hypothetical protein
VSATWLTWFTVITAQGSRQIKMTNITGKIFTENTATGRYQFANRKCRNAAFFKLNIRQMPTMWARITRI